MDWTLSRLVAGGIIISPALVALEGMMKPKEKKIRQELTEAYSMLELEQQRYGQPFRSTLEQIARCLYWLEEPEARYYLLQIIESKGTDSTQAGLFYRMLGDLERSQKAFEQSYKSFRERLDENEYMSVAATAEAAFLVGDYGEAMRLAARYRELDPGTAGLIIDPIGKLARARHTSDPGLAEEAAEEFAEMIRKTRAKVSDTGSINLWDWYEMALQIKAELENAAPVPVEDEVETTASGNILEPSEPDLSGLDLRDESLRQAYLVGANLSRTNLHLQSLDESDLSGANLQDADLSEADLTLAILVNADLRRANLSKTELIETNLKGADLRGAKLTGAEFQDTDFEGADLSGTDLSDIEMWGVEMVRANLKGANLSDAELNHTNFEEANLRGANLSGADLGNADFTGADLTGADLRGARTNNTSFEGATMDDVLR